MNKKVLAIAALALLATTSVASARTYWGPDVPSTPAKTILTGPEAQYRTSPFHFPANDTPGLTSLQSFNHPCDNDMDMNADVS
jgi:hypothetical protein